MRDLSSEMWERSTQECSEKCAVRGVGEDALTPYEVSAVPKPVLKGPAQRYEVYDEVLRLRYGSKKTLKQEPPREGF